MSEENVELVYRVHDAFNGRDIDALLALADPHVEFSPRLLQLEGGDPLHGRDGIRGWWENWLTVVPDFHAEVEEVRDLGDVTVAQVHFRGHGSASGATMDQALWQVAEWQRKKCVRWRVFLTEAEALEAAGLSE